jgi:hypothetical protein
VCGAFLLGTWAVGIVGAAKEWREGRTAGVSHLALHLRARNGVTKVLRGIILGPTACGHVMKRCANDEPGTFNNVSDARHEVCWCSAGLDALL